MARRLTKPKRVAALPLDKWARLDQVFLDVLARLGSSELAAGDLQRAFVDGRLKVATRCARTGECTLLSSAYWREHTVHGWTAPRDSIADPAVFVGASVWREGNPDPIRGLVFFVLRSDFEKLYPSSEQNPDDQPQQPRRKPGPRPKGDWPIVLGAWLIYLAKNNPSALDDGALVSKAYEVLKKEIGWAPRDLKAIRQVIQKLLRRVRNFP